jgi:hypothetical protein
VAENRSVYSGRPTSRFTGKLKIIVAFVWRKSVK